MIDIPGVLEMKQSDVLIMIYRPLIRKAAFAVLLGRKRDVYSDRLGRFNRHDIKLILNDTWAEFAVLKPALPEFQTLGNRMNAQLACLTLSCWNVMLKTKIDPRYSQDLISDLAWHIYRQWSWIVKVITGLSNKDETEQMLGIANVFYRIGANFDLGFQYRYLNNRGRTELLFGQEEHKFQLALVYSVNQIFNNQFDTRNSILNLEHKYLD